MPDAEDPSRMGEAWAQEFLHPVAEVVSAFGDLDALLEDQASGLRYQVSSVSLDMPWELLVRVDEHGAVQLASAPPTQQIRTSIMPVLHRLKLTITAS